ncbi:Hypothetical protein ABZS17G119_02345 [Kosakonia cowanii]
MGVAGLSIGKVALNGKSTMRIIIDKPRSEASAFQGDRADPP